jgi:hypothetical protein
MLGVGSLTTLDADERALSGANSCDVPNNAMCLDITGRWEE